MKKVRKVPEELREKYKAMAIATDPVSLEEEEVDRSYVCNDIESVFLDNPLGSSKELDKFKKQIELYRVRRRIRRLIKMAVGTVFIAAMIWLIIGVKLNNKEMKPILEEIKGNRIEKLIEKDNK